MGKTSVMESNVQINVLKTRVTISLISYSLVNGTLVFSFMIKNKDQRRPTSFDCVYSACLNYQ